MRIPRSTRRCSALVTLLLTPLFVAPLAQAQPRARAIPDAPLTAPPRDWAVAAAANEIVILQHPGSYLRYQMHVIDEKGDQVRDVIESKDGPVARLVLRDGRPLTADEDADERERLEGLVGSPGDYARHSRTGLNGKKTGADLVRLLPDAMLYTYAPGQPQTAHSPGGQQVVLDYHPNPQWSPPSTASEGLTGIEGRMWIDAKTRELLRMEAHVFKPVNFGWGVVARVFPGGEFLLEQTDAGDGRWIYTRFQQDVNVRALMVKSIHLHTEVEASKFHVLPEGMPYQEAIRTLLATPLPRG